MKPTDNNYSFSSNLKFYSSRLNETTNYSFAN